MSKVIKEEYYDLLPEKRLNENYKILSYLGSGWEGEVYKVEELETKVVRVAKLFYNKPDYDKRWHIKYAQKLWRLKTCPIIIQYHHKGKVYLRDQKVHFLIADFIEGEVLSKFIERHKKRKKLSTFEMLHIFYSIVHGIEHIHYLGEYHGDIHTDNIIINRVGLGYDVRLIDILHLGTSNRARIQEDVYDLIKILYELIGGKENYATSHSNLKDIIMGRKKKLIREKFKTAGYLRLHLENLTWD